MSASETHDKLKGHFALLEAHSRAVKKARVELGAKAVEQHDNMAPVMDGYAKEQRAGRGGIFTHRRYRALLTEKSRLAAIVARHETEQDAERE